MEELHIGHKFLRPRPLVPVCPQQCQRENVCTVMTSTTGVVALTPRYRHLVSIAFKLYYLLYPARVCNLNAYNDCPIYVSLFALFALCAECCSRR